MMALSYLIEANLYLVLLYGIYRLFMARSTDFKWNRVFLMIAPIVGILLPLLGRQTGIVENNPTIAEIEDTIPIQLKNLDVLSGSSMQIGDVLPIVYWIVVGVFFLRIFWSIGSLWMLYISGQKNRKGGITWVEIQKGRATFSFFKLLFFSKGETLAKEVWLHEHVHIRQWHSVDVLFLELLRALSWFNPCVHFWVRDAKLNHEYLADEVAHRSTGAQNYALKLIDRAHGWNGASLVNALAYRPQLRKRIAMLGTPKSVKGRLWKTAVSLVMVMVVGSISIFAIEKDYAMWRLGSHKTFRMESMSPNKDRMVWVDATTKRVVIRYAEERTEGSDYSKEKLFAIGDKLYTEREIRSLLDREGEMVILFDERPVLGYYTEGDQSAMAKWGDRAKNGVIYVGDRLRMD